ncbi:MAG: sugar porter family MFS transporter [Candidatus Melainabacteria bacterium]|nr:sugar porter family MFS transporter [Candidatus Melainabacteria bacterium]
MLDVRYPIGYLFLILGIILAGYGYANPATFNTAGGPLPLNIDVPWGILMFLFGLATVSVSKLDEVRALEALSLQETIKETAKEAEKETERESAPEGKPDTENNSDT